MQDNLGGDFKEVQSAYEAVGTDLFDQQESSLRKLVQTATGYVLKLDKWIQRNKALAQTLGVITAVALGVVGMIGAIGLIAWPVITGVNAIIAAASARYRIYNGGRRHHYRCWCDFLAGCRCCGCDCRRGIAHPQILGAHQRIFRRCN